jgi:hypothetical protein
MKASNLLNTLKVYMKRLINAVPDIILLAYGHLISRDSELPSRMESHIFTWGIDDLLRADLQRFELGVLRMLRTMQPTQSEFDALVSFSFNLGLGMHFNEVQFAQRLYAVIKRGLGKFF